MAESYASLIDFADSWASATVAITPYGGAALDKTDISAVSHSGSITRGAQNSGGRKIARTVGSVVYEASITFYRRGLIKLVDTMVAVAPEYALRGNQIRIGLVTFDLDIHHSLPGNPRIAHTRIKGARLNGYTDDMSEGDEADLVELPLDVMENANVLPDGREVVLL